MKYQEIVSIPGMTGLYTVLNQKSNGVIVKSLDDDKSQFVSLRSGGFAVLDNISVYTQTDTIPLMEVFNKMKLSEENLPIIEASAGNEDLRAYFEKILPSFDRDRVKVSDIKKIIKWYHILNKHELLPVKLPTEPKDDIVNETA